QLGNIAIDRRNTAGGAAGQFWAYQSFVAPSAKPPLLSSLPVLGGATYNEAFMAVTKDGGKTWTDRPIPCSVSTKSLNHQFPNVSVAPDGTVWASWSDGEDVLTAVSRDHGSTWACSPAVSTNTAQAIFPWMVATSAGVDLVYYGTTTPESSTDTPTRSVYFVQNLASTAGGWGTPAQLMPVHEGAVCDEGVQCTTGRQLLDDFGIDTDPGGFAHIAYSHDSPNLGGATTFTGYARQIGGTPVGYPN
ncbi:MAG: glycoside hydrolase, partial [Actinobacteria bacterium]|nr:glycoside hydrolase [Actinomycetota bacterium]